MENNLNAELVEYIKKEVKAFADDAKESSFEDIWDYLCQIFDFSNPNECIKKSAILHTEIVKNHGIIPDNVQTPIKDTEKFNYSSIIGGIIKLYYKSNNFTQETHG